MPRLPQYGIRVRADVFAAADSILIHQASAGFQGTAADIEVQAREIIRIAIPPHPFTEVPVHSTTPI
jgi:Clp protease